MAVEVTPVDPDNVQTNADNAAKTHDNSQNHADNSNNPPDNSDTSLQQVPEAPSAPPAPKKRGRPAGARDKQPRARKRPPPPSPISSEEEVTRREPRRAEKRAPRSPSSESYHSAEAPEVLLSPRSRQRNAIAQRREQMAVVHQARVNRYTTMLHRMLV